VLGEPEGNADTNFGCSFRAGSLWFVAFFWVTTAFALRMALLSAWIKDSRRISMQLARKHLDSLRLRVDEEES